MQRAKASSWDWDETENRPAVNGRKASSIWPAIRFHHENILQEKSIPIVNIILHSSRSSRILRNKLLRISFRAGTEDPRSRKITYCPPINTPKKKEGNDDDENLLVIIKTYYPADKIYVASFALFHMLKRFMVSEWSFLRHFRFNVWDFKKAQNEIP